MSQNTIREISKRRFDAYCYSRAPFIRYGWKEQMWFEAYAGKLFGAVVLDLSDQDYGYIILGRDKRKVFRTMDWSKEFFATSTQASEALLKNFPLYESDGKDIYEQGDEKELPNEVLTPKVPDEKLHPYFKFLIKEERFEAARTLIKEIIYSYVDVDGNYIKDFQTTGFDARLWELYLYIYLHNAGFKIDNTFQAPDYCLSYFGEQLSIEAVTVNANPNFDEKKGPSDLRETHLLSLDYMPIKYGSPLFSKLKKKYWEQSHVKEKPLILAIHDYHIAASSDSLGSMTWSRSALCDYLYGYRMKVTIDPDGKLINHVEDTGHGIKPILEKITEHVWKGKKIPSGFFFLPDAENISAVLFTNTATITTFNRMGKLAGLGSEKFKMLRVVHMYDPDPYASKPLVKMFDVDDPDYEESWADGMIMYHNPKAKYPVHPDLFPDISHMFFDTKKNELYGHMQPFDVLGSVTTVLVPKADSNFDSKHDGK